MTFDTIFDNILKFDLIFPYTPYEFQKKFKINNLIDTKK